MSSMLLIIYALMFLGAILLLEGGMQLLSALRRPESHTINRRLRLLDSGYDPEEIYRLLRRKHDDRGWIRFAGIARLNEYLQQAGVTVSLRFVVLLVVMIAAFLGAVGTLVFHLPPVVAFAGGGLAVTAVGFLHLSRRRKARLAALELQLPEMLDLIVRSVRSGHPLSSALRLAADELPEPLGSEVGLLVDETTYGVSLIDAVDGLAARVGLNDYNYFAVVAKITGKTGGNLANILDNLSAVIRERNRMRRKIHAISSEGRTSGLVMSLAPPMIAGLIMVTSPDFFMSVADDPLFSKMMILVVGLCLANIVVLRRLVTFEF